jgi:hypothetical protein
VYQQLIFSVMKRSRIFFALIFAGTLSIASAAAATNLNTQQITMQFEEGSDQDILRAASFEIGISLQELEYKYDCGEVQILPALNGDHEVRLLDADGNPVISVVISEL